MDTLHVSSFNSNQADVRDGHAWLHGDCSFNRRQPFSSLAVTTHKPSDSSTWQYFDWSKILPPCPASAASYKPPIHHFTTCSCRHGIDIFQRKASVHVRGYSFLPGKLSSKMMKKKANAYGRSKESSSSSARGEEETEWEMRPGGMLVQKRSAKPDAPTPNLRLRIAYGALRYEISVSSMATFGEVKKVMSGETGLEADEQRVVYRGKERENGEYLDMCGVKDGSKLVLIQDPYSIERRFIQTRRNAKIQTAHRAINHVSLQLDHLEHQVSAIEKSISDGVKVPEVQITTLIEMLMRQAIKLESISAEGDASAQKKLQGKRVQKCVETLDILKVSNARIKPAVVTTKWETFDHPPSSCQWELFE